MKFFDRYCQPYAEYCARTTLSEEELKNAVKEECPAKWDVISWKVIKSSLWLSKEPVFSCNPDDPLKLYPGRSGRNGLQVEISIQCEKCSTGTILHIKIAPGKSVKMFTFLWIAAALTGGIIVSCFIWWGIFAALFYIGWFFIVAEFCRANAAEEVPKVRQGLTLLIKKLEQNAHK
jgi:hypothetical protein